MYVKYIYKLFSCIIEFTKIKPLVLQQYQFRRDTLAVLREKHRVQSKRIWHAMLLSACACLYSQQIIENPQIKITILDVATEREELH